MCFIISPDDSLRPQKGINIQITEKKDGNLPVDCLFCSEKAVLWVKASNTYPLVEVRICMSPQCCSQAFSYALHVGYKIPLEGCAVDPQTCKAINSF